MIYDHRKKAGNKGDIVKHIALLAALDGVLSQSDKNTFTYADIFTGFPFIKLIAGNDWETGIGRLKTDKISSDNSHVRRWYQSYISGKNQPNGIYPGSSVIAADEILRHGKSPALFLWDIADAVIKDLKLHFGNFHRIFQEIANSESPLLRQTDFIFIDPPGTASDRHPQFPEPDYLFSFFSNHCANMLMWLPLYESVMASAHSKKAMERHANDLDLSEVTVEWEPDTGCRLLLRLPYSAETKLRAAMDAVTRDLFPATAQFTGMTEG